MGSSQPRRAVELIEQAEEALEEEKNQRQRQHELAVEERAKRRDAEGRAQEGEERRKDVRLIVEAEERLTACRDLSRRENALLVSTLVCVLATVALLFVTVLRGDPLLLGGPAFTSLLSAAGGYLLHSSAAVTSGS